MLKAEQYLKAGRSTSQAIIHVAIGSLSWPRECSNWEAFGMQCEAVSEHKDALAGALSTRYKHRRQGLDGPLFVFNCIAVKIRGYEN
jgi:hypothetical protein